MSDGIGSYYSPSPLRPVPMGSLGSYYSPEPLRPIPHTSGLGNDSGASNGPAMVGALLVLGIIGAAFMGAK